MTGCTCREPKGGAREGSRRGKPERGSQRGKGGESERECQKRDQPRGGSQIRKPGEWEPRVYILYDEEKERR